MRWLVSGVAALGMRWFAADDELARQHGWQITERRGGLGRSYRDPRFDTLRACAGCAGRGAVDGEPCGPCDGTGRVTVARRQTQGQSP